MLRRIVQSGRFNYSRFGDTFGALATTNSVKCSKGLPEHWTGIYALVSARAVLRPRPRVRRGARALVLVCLSIGCKSCRGIWANILRSMNCSRTRTRVAGDLASSTTSAKVRKLFDVTKTFSPGLKRRQSPPWSFMASIRFVNEATTSSGTDGTTPPKLSQPTTWGASRREGFPAPSKSHRRKR